MKIFGCSEIQFASTIGPHFGAPTIEKFGFFISENVLYSSNTSHLAIRSASARRYSCDLLVIYPDILLFIVTPDAVYRALWILVLPTFPCLISVRCTP